jgi:hypothetical protein
VEAVVTAKWLIAHGYNIDMGLGQINSINLAKLTLSVEDVFDPCKNLAAAAVLLRSNYQSASRKVPGGQAALHAALSAYNTGSFSRGFTNGYVQKVIRNASADAVKPISVAKAVRRENWPQVESTNGETFEKNKSAGTADSQEVVSGVHGEDVSSDLGVMVYR